MTSYKSSQRDPVHPLRFVGERHRPLLPEEVVRRRPELGTMARPAELETLASRQREYIRSTSEDEPRVEVSRVEQGDQSDLWQVDIPIDRTTAAGAMYGQTGMRRDPEEFLAEIDANVDFRSYRPEWTDSLPVPRVLPDVGASPMIRLDGRRLVRPFWTRFPPEERQVYRDASWPWGLACKIFTNTGAQGSGALIGDRLVVTAGHMVPPDGSWWIRVVPDYYDGASLHGAGVQSYVSDWRDSGSPTSRATTGPSSGSTSRWGGGWGSSGSTATTMTGRTGRTGQRWAIRVPSPAARVRPDSSAWPSSTTIRTRTAARSWRPGRT